MHRKGSIFDLDSTSSNIFDDIKNKCKILFKYFEIYIEVMES